MRRGRVAAVTAACALAAAACGEAEGAGSDPAPPLTVGEALQAGDEPVMVSGYLFAHDGGVLLCETIAESYPPQCGGASLPAEGVTVEDLDGLASEGDRSWSDGPVVLRGTVSGATLQVTERVG